MHKNSWLEKRVGKPKVFAENQRICKEAEKQVDIDAHLEERIQWEQEKAERRKLWEEQKAAEDEEKVRREKRARMEAWLNSRRQAWLDHTGSLPPASTVEGWKGEYIAERASEEERERAFRLALAEDIFS